MLLQEGLLHDAAAVLRDDLEGSRAVPPATADVGLLPAAGRGFGLDVVFPGRAVGPLADAADGQGAKVLVQKRDHVYPPA